MSDTWRTVASSARSNGRDTLPHKATNFIDVDLISNDNEEYVPEVRELWSEEHSALSKARRESRENRPKPPKVAEVPDFDMEAHIKERAAEEARLAKSKN